MLLNVSLLPQALALVGGADAWERVSPLLALQHQFQALAQFVQDLELAQEQAAYGRQDMLVQEVVGLGAQELRGLLVLQILAVAVAVLVIMILAHTLAAQAAQVL